MTTRQRLPGVHQSDHWAAHARQWAQLATPLRPHADDIAIVRRWLDDPRWIDGNACGLLLGVTPELGQASGRHTLIALDRERAMIDMLHAATDRRDAVQGDWLTLPFAEHSLDFAIGDGSFNLLQYPQHYHALFQQLRRTLRRGAPLLVRVFARPDREETCAAVVGAAFAGTIASFHAFKWRFAMALAARYRSANIGVADIHREFCAWVVDRDALAQSSGWPRGAIDTIDVYRDSAAVYSFPTLEEWRVIAARYGVELDCAHGDYELAERCPLLLHRFSP